ncbi:MAG: DNA mismatch repair endonuclease MutL [Christensenellaceae bacterium]
MMNRINLLDETVYARIAAGEVVGNPAAVVKELIENAIDANATAITVEILQGGKELIRVTDNGSGIHPDDVLLTIQKHATSKLSKLEDLSEIATLGFRGEALCSIAAVSRLCISTRMHGSIEGAVLTASGQSEPLVVPAGLAEGTTVKVEDLFYNIPARRKFLKNTTQEAVQVTSIVSKLLLANPQISIKYINNGKTMFQSPGNNQLKDSILTIYGVGIANKIREVSYNNNEIRIDGYISEPAFLYKSTNHMNIYLNGRYIKSKSLQDSVIHGYGERLLRGHYPFAVLNIGVAYSKTDVNIHPNKLQVMIDDEIDVIDAVESAVKLTLSKNTPPEIILSTDQPFFSQENHQSEEDSEISFPDFKSADRLYKPTVSKANQAAQSANFLMDYPKYDEVQDFDKLIDSVIAYGAKKEEQQIIEDVRTLTDFRIIGQAWNSFLIVESGENLYLIDQHAAHERINFERMKQNGADKQLLLIPYIATFTHADFELLKINHKKLQELGFEYDEFGPLTYKFDALPVQVEKSNEATMIDEILNELRNSPKEPLVLRDKIIRAACRYSIKAGYQLSDEQILELITEITKLNAIPTCPHGRPIAVVLTKTDLEKGFKRK